jgi:hypothetical protein
MNITTKRALALIGTEVVLAASIAYAGVTGLHGTAVASPQEDDPGFSCVTDGNRICGPGNANGVPPGCYDAGVLVAPWPCSWHEGTGALPGPVRVWTA